MGEPGNICLEKEMGAVFKGEYPIMECIATLEE